MRRHARVNLLTLLVVAALWPALSVASPGRGTVAGEAPPSSIVWTVTSSADSGPGTLREALLQARAGDTIAFDPVMFPVDSPATILPGSQLPTITQDGLTLDGSHAGVILDGSSVAGEVFWGLGIEANGVAVRGLQIIHFAGNGIELRGRNNVIGGDRHSGDGPLGQGNLVSMNAGAGIALLDSGTVSNTIQGNLVGVDPSGSLDWGNGGAGIGFNAANHNLVMGNVIGGNATGVQGCCTPDTSYNVIRDNWIGVGMDGTTPIPNKVNGVWLHDGASHNTVGPGNLIAYNLSSGVILHTVASQGNTITQNRIWRNGSGIDLVGGSNGGLAAPAMTGFDLASGIAMGRACAGCLVEVFSDQDDQGGTYEGSVRADAAGRFAFLKGAALAGPHLTATATDEQGNTSSFSMYTTGSGEEWVIQAGNSSHVSRLQPKASSELANNHISGGSANPHQSGGSFNEFLAWLEKEQLAQGLKYLHISLNEGEEPIDWSRSEYLIEQQDDDWIDVLNESGVEVVYVLSFWDKANHPAGWPPISSRFTTEEEVLRYLDYVRFVVTHFKGRIAYYDLWNEPDNRSSTIQYIRPEDFVELIRRAVPAIREIDPDARIVVPSVAYLRNQDSRDYLYHIIQSDVMSLVDVVAWHPLYGTSPDYEEDREYYYAYPQIVGDIQRTAAASGFAGAFRADEIYWRSPDCEGGCDPSLPMHTNITAAKYLGRGVVTNLGLGVIAGGGTSVMRRPSFAMISNLATIFAGSEAAFLPFSLALHDPVTHVASYAFSLPDDRYLVAFWNDGVAEDEDPGARATLTLPGLAGYVAVGMDPLHGIAQVLVTQDGGESLVISDLRLKDYPLLIRLSPQRRAYLPAVRR